MRTVLLLIASALTASAYSPAQADLDFALAEARGAWRFNITLPIEFRVEPLSTCDKEGSVEAANSQVYDFQSRLILDDGTFQVLGHSYTYVIRVNSNCDWNRFSLRNVVAHEYGHLILGAGHHSSDPHSIMFWKVTKYQEVTEEDRREASEVGDVTRGSGHVDHDAAGGSHD